MISIKKDNPIQNDNLKNSVQLTHSNYQQRTTNVEGSNVKLDLSKLSVLSKEYLKFKNIFGFRPLVVHPTLTSCLPYQAAREKRDLYIRDLYKKRQATLSAVEVDIKDKATSEVKANIEHYSNLHNQETDTVKKQNYKSLIETEKRYLERLKTIKITETNLMHPDILEIDNQIKKLRGAQLHIKNGGTCQACGVTLPDSMEKHIDFLTSETRLLCPFCHLTEHIDEAAELKAGYIGFMPTISQEQINLFTYCYFILKYIMEDNKELPENIRQQLEDFRQRPITPNLTEITYKKLYEKIDIIRQEMIKSGNVLIDYFKFEAKIEKDHLVKEFSQKIGKKIETQIEDYIISEKQKFGDPQGKNTTNTYYSYNLDNMNMPEFYAGIMIANGAFIHSPNSVEEKLNVITRLDGLRFIPSYTFFKPYLDSWQRVLLTTGFEAMMSNFFIAFEDLIEIKKVQFDKRTGKPVENTEQSKQPKAATIQEAINLLRNKKKADKNNSVNTENKPANNESNNNESNELSPEKEPQPEPPPRIENENIPSDDVLQAMQEAKEAEEDLQNMLQSADSVDQDDFGNADYNFSSDSMI